MNYITSEKFKEFLNALKKAYDVYAPVKKDEQRFYKKLGDVEEDIVIGEVRAFEPLKAFFFKAKEIVAEGFKSDIPHAAARPLAIIGVKSCDLKGFKTQDHLFKDHDYEDPFYIKARNENLVISADCTFAIETCFCAAMGIKPYPEEGFDINLSKINGGFVVTVGSDKGRGVVDKNSGFFEEVTERSVLDKAKIRGRVVKEVEENINVNNTPRQDRFRGIIEKNYGSDIWKDEASECVECGACNAICPTCHCFFLADQKSEARMARFRLWDSCMMKDFARVAGGANPRSRLWMRLRNRFEKKFDYFPKVTDVYACTGCGRCISACPAKIDIRKVLGKLAENA